MERSRSDPSNYQLSHVLISIKFSKFSYVQRVKDREKDYITFVTNTLLNCIRFIYYTRICTYCNVSWESKQYETEESTRKVGHDRSFLPRLSVE